MHLILIYPDIRLIFFPNTWYPESKINIRPATGNKKARLSGPISGAVQKITFNDICLRASTVSMYVILNFLYMNEEFYHTGTGNNYFQSLRPTKNSRHKIYVQ
jgi:hypothetical protein